MKNVKPIHVTRDQVSAARALIELRGGIENVDALTAKIATAIPRSSLTEDFAEGIGDGTSDE